MSVGFGGYGWGVGFGFGGAGWGVSVGFSGGWGYGGYAYGGCGYGAWNGCWSPYYAGACSTWWPWSCSTWYAPWYCGAYWVPSPIVYSYPVYAPLVAAPVIVEQPVVYTPSLDWPGYASIDGANPGDPMLAASGSASTAPLDLSVTMPPAGYAEQEAWDLLSTGREALAEEQFAHVLNAEPDNARARAGYGLAAALTGREATAVWALRDAVALRPDVLDFLPLMPSVRTRLTDLARNLEMRGTQPAQPNAVDELFLAAAMRVAVGDRAQAAYAMELAARRGTLDAVRADFRTRLSEQLASGL